MTGEQTCPGCGLTKSEEEWPADIKDLGTRTQSGVGVQILSVGFRCPECGTVWGHKP